MGLSDGVITIKTAIDNRRAKVDLADLERQADDVARRINQNDKARASASTEVALAEGRKTEALHAYAEAVREANDAITAYIEKEKTFRERAEADGLKGRKLDAEAAAYMADTPEGRARAAAESARAAAGENVQSASAGLDAAQQKLQGLEVEAEQLAERGEQVAASMHEWPSAIDVARTAVGMLAGAFQLAWRGAQKVLQLAQRLGKSLVQAFNRARQATAQWARQLITGNKFLKTIISRTRRLLISMLAFQYISSAIKGMVNYVKQAVAQTDGFNEALGNVKGAASQVGAAFATIIGPAITAFLQMLAVALSYLAKLFSYFSGKKLGDIQKTAKTAAGAASKTADLAGFDELNRLSDSSGGGAGDSAPNYTFEAQNSFLDSVLEQLKAGNWGEAGKLLAEKLNSLIEDFDAKAWGQKMGAKIQNGISLFYNFITTFNWNNVGVKVAQALNGVLEQINPQQLGAVMAAKFTIAIRALGGLLQNIDPGAIASTVTGLATSFFGAITEAIRSVDWVQVGHNLASAIGGVDWAAVASSIGSFFGTAIRAAFDFLKGTGVFDWFAEQFRDGIFQGIINVLKGIASWVYDNIFLPFFNAVCDAFQIHSPSRAMMELGEYVMQGFLQGLQNLWQSLKDSVSAIKAMVVGKFNELKTSAASIWESLRSGTAAKFNAIKTQATAVATTVKTFVVNAFNNARTGVLNALTGLKNGAVAIFEGLKNTLRSPINTIIGYLNGLISGAVNAVNRVIDTMNGLSITVPGWVPEYGGRTFGFDIPRLSGAISIPRLAQGAVIPPNHEFMAVLGDQTSGTNIEAPLDTIKAAVAEDFSEYADALAAGFAAVIAAIEDKDTGVYIGDEAIGRAATRYNRRQAIRRGTTV